MPAAMTPLATQTISGTTTTSVTFSSISGSYRDLILVVDGTTPSSVSLLVRFNGDTTSANYTFAGMSGAASTPSGSSGNQGGVFFNNYATLSTTPALFALNIFDYAQTNKHKTTIYQAARANGGVDVVSHRWGSTAAITSISCSILSGNFDPGTVFSLYGVSA